METVITLSGNKGCSIPDDTEVTSAAISTQHLTNTVAKNENKTCLTYPKQEDEVEKEHNNDYFDDYYDADSGNDDDKFDSNNNTSGGMSVDLGIVDTSEYAAIRPSVHLETITKLLCQDNTAPPWSVFHFSKLHQNLPLPGIAIHHASTPPVPRTPHNKQLVLPVSLSTVDLSRISQTFLHGQRYAHASQLTGETHCCLPFVCYIQSCI
jgi:hypothetical protein